MSALSGGATARKAFLAFPASAHVSASRPCRALVLDAPARLATDCVALLAMLPTALAASVTPRRCCALRF